MAITLKEIKKFLDIFEMKIMKSDEDAIVFGIGDGENHGAVFIRIKEDGDLFVLQMEPLNDDLSHYALPSNTKHLNKIMGQLLFYNYNTKFGTWEYDPNEGDLRFAVEIPLEDAPMTQKQFRRILSMVQTNLSYIKEIREIQNGQMDSINGQNGEKIEKLEHLFAMLKNDSKDTLDVQNFSLENGI